MIDIDRPIKSNAWRPAHHDEVGILGINSADKSTIDTSQSLLDTKAGRTMFYTGMTYGIGCILYATKGLAVERIKSMMHKGRNK